ncbi:MAG: serine protease [Lachnospiraceae bacterium]
MRVKAIMSVKAGIACLGCLLLLFGCGKQNNMGETSDGSKPAAESLISSLVEEEQDEGEQAESLREALRPSVVRIEVNEYFGSGVIWDIDDEKITILSCRHLLEKDNTCDVIFFEGEYCRATVKELSEDYDIGFAEIPISEMDREDVLSLKKVTRSSRTAEQMIKGEEVVIFGSMDYVAANYSQGYLMDTDVTVEIPSLFSAQSMMVCYGEIDAGMSGSGVFDENGSLIGIVSAGKTSELKINMEYTVENDTENDTKDDTEDVDSPIFVAVPIWHM